MIYAESLTRIFNVSLGQSVEGDCLASADPKNTLDTVGPGDRFALTFMCGVWAHYVGGAGPSKPDDPPLCHPARSTICPPSRGHGLTCKTGRRGLYSSIIPSII